MVWAFLAPLSFSLLRSDINANVERIHPAHSPRLSYCIVFYYYCVSARWVSVWVSGPEMREEQNLIYRWFCIFLSNVPFHRVLSYKRTMRVSIWGGKGAEEAIFRTQQSPAICRRYFWMLCNDTGSYSIVSIDI